MHFYLCLGHVEDSSDVVRHHRHWQKVLGYVSGLRLVTRLTPLPQHGTILGGTMDLKGNNISLACFHGINFRSKSWALFSLREPNIEFATEVQNIMDESKHWFILTLSNKN